MHQHGLEVMLAAEQQPSRACCTVITGDMPCKRLRSCSVCQASLVSDGDRVSRTCRFTHVSVAGRYPLVDIVQHTRSMMLLVLLRRVCMDVQHRRGIQPDLLQDGPGPARVYRVLRKTTSRMIQPEYAQRGHTHSHTCQNSVQTGAHIADSNKTDVVTEEVGCTCDDFQQVF